MRLSPDDSLPFVMLIYLGAGPIAPLVSAWRPFQGSRFGSGRMRVAAKPTTDFLFGGVLDANDGPGTIIRAICRDFVECN